MASEQYIYSGNKMRSHVKAGDVEIHFRLWFCFEFEKNFHTTSFSRNLILVLRLVLLGYSFNFSKTSLNLFYKYNLVQNSTLTVITNLQDNTFYNVMRFQDNEGTK